MTYELEPLRFSRLKLLAKSPAHFLANVREETASMREGSATHSYLLGDKDSVVVYSDGARNERHKKYQDFLSANEGKLILSPKEFENVQAMRLSIERHPRAMELLDGIREQRITWTMSGRECAGTPDVVHLRDGKPSVLVELKTAQSAALDLFKWQARKLSYHGQLSWYAQGLSLSMDYSPAQVREVFIVAVESSPPHPVTVFHVTPRMLDRGKRQWRLWFETLLVCERTGNFPAYTESDVDWDDDETDLDWDEEAA